MVFLRSEHGRDAVNSLWVYDIAQNVERKLVDPRSLLSDTDDIPAAERARRERLRETTSGITAYSSSEMGNHIAFALAGQLFFTDVATATTRTFDAPGPIIDPRISPDGTMIAWSTGAMIYCINVLSSDTTVIAGSLESPEEHVTWGLADFIAAEEFDRSHGLWWLADNSGLIVERCDESSVQQWWISDPANPQKEPISQRYPAAGTPNAEVSLFLSDLNGALTEINWPKQDYEYLLNVRCSSDSQPIISVSSRDQKVFVHYTLAGTTLTTLATLHDDAFLEVIPGQPIIHNNNVISVLDDVPTDTRAIAMNGSCFSPQGLQVHSVISVTDTYVDVIASYDSTLREIVRVDYAGTATHLTVGGISSATSEVEVGSDFYRVVVQSRLESHSRTFELWLNGSPIHVFDNLAETPAITPNVYQLETGPQRVKTAVLFPTDHQMGSKALPILMRPYSGPHGAQVLDGALTYVEDQWYADQGFVVVIADGRGTPGRGPLWDKSIHLDFVTAVLADQVTAIRDVASHFPDDVDASRVGIMGWSFGGYLSALAVMQEPDVFHAAVAGAPVTDWTLYDTAYTERYLGNPNSDPQVYQHNSLFQRAAKLSRPLMLIHGLADDNVVSAHTLKLSSELLAHRKDHTVLPLSGVTHMTPQEVVAENLMFLSVEFLKQHLNESRTSI
ncbi:MAG: prolyl oligopeptidase family serine peptidase [Actinobacteria bacterium]|uniref:Unannotated protein n=1 Tax=freshwater metagenome TaxID=449393 RepID=A0A6J5YVY0_9ZZZZ|nr:prolyl oligopeptidase family serine peptidase [Actinomycetota bacterium]